MCPYSFSPRLWPTIGALLALGLFIQLGHWQYGKSLATEAEAMERETRGAGAPMPLPEVVASPEGFSHARLRVTGHFVGTYQFYLDNRQEDGVAGYQVLTPFQPDQAERWVLVNRGWRAWPQGRRGMPQEAVPEGEFTVVGLGEIPSTKALFMMPNQGDTEGLLRMKVDLGAFAAWSKHPIQPIVLLEQSGPEDGLSRRWPPPEDKTLMHRGYAYQWWGMALATVGFFFYASVRKRASSA